MSSAAYCRESWGARRDSRFVCGCAGVRGRSGSLAGRYDVVEMRAGMQPALGAPPIDARFARRGGRRAAARPMPQRPEERVGAAHSGGQADGRRAVAERERQVQPAHALWR